MSRIKGRLQLKKSGIPFSKPVNRYNPKPLLNPQLQSLLVNEKSRLQTDNSFDKVDLQGNLRQRQSLAVLPTSKTKRANEFTDCSQSENIAEEVFDFLSPKGVSR
jgi:hypothetical protein